MIRLNNTPNEGSTVKVNLGFRDSAGQYYIPTKIQYTLLALNNDKETWSIVDEIYLKSLTPASSVTLTIPNIKTVEGTTLQRKVMVYWDAFVDNEYNSFVDEIRFDITPKPYVPDEPVNPPPEPTIYVKINQVNMQIGTLTAVPLSPVFLIKTNLPVDIENAVAQIITQEGEVKDCIITVDSTDALLTVSTDFWLEYQTSYTLKISGLVSTINHYVMENDFECAFATQSKDAPHELVIQDSKTVSITENGEQHIFPDEEYDGVAEIIANVNVQPNLQEKTINENGEVLPDTEYVGLSRVMVDVEPPLQQKTVYTNGDVEPDNEYYGLRKVVVDVEPPLQQKTVHTNGDVEPDSEYYGLSKVIVDIPAVPIETGKTATFLENGTTVISPSSGYEAMNEVEVTVNVPGPKPEQTKTETITSNGTTTVTPDEGKVLTSVDVITAVPLQEKEVNVVIPTGDIEITPDTGYEGMESVIAHVAVPIETGRTETISSNGTVTISPSTGNVALDEVEVTVAVPLETNKTESIDVKNYTDPVEITPTSGNDGMKKVTVTLTNIPNIFYCWKCITKETYMYTTYPTSAEASIAYEVGSSARKQLSSLSVEMLGNYIVATGWTDQYARFPSGDIMMS